MQAAAGELVTKRGEDSRVGSTLRRVRLLSKQRRFAEAESEIKVQISEFPGRCELHAALGYVYKKRTRTVEAVEQFKWAHEFGKPRCETYWHWSEIEADREKWSESERIAKLGVASFRTDAGLLFRQGYALQRLGKEYVQTARRPEGLKKCADAQAVLERALQNCEADQSNRSLRTKILRTLVLSGEIREDIGLTVKFFAQWDTLLPGDPNFATEKDRLAQRYAVLSER